MKKNKKYGLYLIAIVLVVGLSLLHPYFNGKNPIISYVHHIVWGNVIEIEAAQNVDKRNVTVIFKNEFALVEDRSQKEYENLNTQYNYTSISDTVIKNGKQISDIPYDYGKQILIAYYRQIEIGRLGLWKTNNWHSHKYYLKISEDQGKYKMEGEILGPDNKN